MKKFIFFSMLIAFSKGSLSNEAFLRVYRKPIRVAVVDTGYSKHPSHYSVPLCDEGHAETHEGILRPVQIPPPDELGHGTNVAHIITDQAKGIPHCLVIIRFWRSKDSSNISSTLAFKHAISLGVDIINFSANGEGEIERETLEIKRALDLGILVVAAAGNEGVDIEKNKSYPAMVDPRVIVVGSKDRQGKRLSSSNFGKPVDFWELGERVSAGGITLTGTSQATAVVTGKLIRYIYRNKKPTGVNK